MSSGKLTWFVVAQFIIFQGCSCLNTTQKVTGEPLQPLNMTLSTISLPKETTLSAGSTESAKTTEMPQKLESLNTSTTKSQNVPQLIKDIFDDLKNDTVPTEGFSVDYAIITDCTNASSVNLSCPEQLLNNTFKTNYTTVAEAVESSEGSLPYRLQNSAAIAAGMFLISAVVGYLSCVGYRRFLQRKYGNSQILIGEEVYDTSDLRYFEI